MIEIQWIIAYLGLGLLVGFFAGLFGIGGGGIMVPILTSLFLSQGFDTHSVIHIALATSMTSIIFTAIASSKAHHQHRAVIWSIVTTITPGIIFGTFSATFIASQIPTQPLAIFFSIFMAYISIQLLLNIKPKPSRQLPNTLGMNIVGTFIGSVSALVAIGGGTLSVPFMLFCNVDAKKAIGTSAAIGLPIALSGSCGYLISGWNITNLPEYTLGYIYLPAVLLISSTSLLTAPLGAKLAHKLPIPRLKKLFAGLLILLSLKMLHSLA